tara:strand:+ start:1405 stop:2289 length:885 start_codon:yes stop_codon:yes gene_type:complete
MIKFFIIGSSGYIAKKHIDCIYNSKGNLIAACDIKTDGYLDRYFPDADFIDKENEFFFKIKKLKGNKKLVICSPNYLHTKHIIQGLSSGCDVLCEKPPVLLYEDLIKIRNAEIRFKRKCFFVLQLRFDKNILLFKKKLNTKNYRNNINNIRIDYITHRGNWYKKSWKGIKKKSGGIVYNIGIHLFDLLYYLFGEFKKIKVVTYKNDLLKLKLKIKKINVDILLSTNKIYLPSNLRRKKIYQYRNINIDNFKLDFSKKFHTLHENVYKKFIKNKGFRIDDFIYIIKTLNKYFKIN